MMIKGSAKIYMIKNIKKSLFFFYAFILNEKMSLKKDEKWKRSDILATARAIYLLRKHDITSFYSVVI